jgi:uncharacterized protein (UPF0297 family)
LINKRFCIRMETTDAIGCDDMPEFDTTVFRVEQDDTPNAKDIILEVFKSLEERGYNPISQFVGYMMSGDPTYITSHNNARSIIRRVERDEILEELLKTYLKHIRGSDFQHE